MNLTAQLTKKRKESRPCKECGIDIEVGQEYISVFYSDGFRKLPHGAYHQNCWEKSVDNPKRKKGC